MAPRAHPKVTLEQRYFGFFMFKELLLYPPQAIVMKLHGRDISYVVIFILETVGLLGL